MQDYFRRCIVFVVVLVAIFGAVYFANGTLRFGISCHNSKCFVGASSSFLSTLISIALLMFVLLFPQQEMKAQDNVRVGTWRRLFSAFFDSWVVIIVSTSISVLIILLLEYQATDVFSWRFVRDFLRSSDWPVFTVCMFFNTLILFMYFYFFAKFRKSTLGQIVMGYSIFPNEDVGKSPRYFVRTLALIVVAFTWVISIPISWFITHVQKEGGRIYWWDRVGHTRARKVRR